MIIAVFNSDTKAQRSKTNKSKHIGHERFTNKKWMNYFENSVRRYWTQTKCVNLVASNRWHERTWTLTQPPYSVLSTFIHSLQWFAHLFTKSVCRALTLVWRGLSCRVGAFTSFPTSSKGVCLFHLSDAVTRHLFQNFYMQMQYTERKVLKFRLNVCRTISRIGDTTDRSTSQSNFRLDSFLHCTVRFYLWFAD